MPDPTSRLVDPPLIASPQKGWTLGRRFHAEGTFTLGRLLFDEAARTHSTPELICKLYRGDEDHIATGVSRVELQGMTATYAWWSSFEVPDAVEDGRGFRLEARWRVGTGSLSGPAGVEDLTIDGQVAVSVRVNGDGSVADGVFTPAAGTNVEFYYLRVGGGKQKVHTATLKGATWKVANAKADVSAGTYDPVAVLVRGGLHPAVAVAKGSPLEFPP